MKTRLVSDNDSLDEDGGVMKLERMMINDNTDDASDSSYKYRAGGDGDGSRR